MALQDMLGGLPPGLLSAEQQAQAERQARNALITNLGFGLLQASRGQPGQGKPSLGQMVGQVGPGAVQAFQGSFDQTLRNIMLNEQMKDAQAKRAQEQTRQAALTRFASTLPEDQRALAQAFPEQFATQRFREAPGVVGEFQAAKAAGEVPPTTTLTEYIAMKRPPGTTVNVGERATPFEKKAQESQAEAFSEIQKSGTSAARSSREITRLGNILEKVGTGGAAAFKQAAGNFGIKTEGLDDIQAAQAIINKLVPQQRPPGSGTMSDADLALYKESLPRLINQPGANREIIRSMKDINEYLVKEGQIASDVLDGKLTPAEGRQKLFELGNPIQDFFERNQAASPGSPRTQLPRADEDLINRYLRR
jgi:flagellar protein FlgJ